MSLVFGRMPFWFADAMIVLVMVVFFAVPAHADEELHILTWSDYLSPEVVARFERKTGVKVVIEGVDAGDRLLQILRAGDRRLDLANPLDHQVPLLIQEGRLEEINAGALAGFSNVDSSWRQPPYDPNSRYSVPFHWGTTSFVADTAILGQDIDRYEVLFNPPDSLRGRTSFLIGAAELIRMGLIYLGLPSCSTEPADLERVLGLIRPLVNPALVATISTAVDTLTRDQVAVGMAWNGDALRARLKRPSLRYAYPPEGVLIWSDVLTIPKGSANRSAALAFISFMLEPEIAALQSNFTHYANSIRGSDAFLDPEILEAPEIIIPTRILLRFIHFCGGNTLDLYERIHNQLLRNPNH